MESPAYMTNAQGHLVPTDKVKPEDVLENDLVLGLFSQAEALSKALAAFKATAFGDYTAFLDLLSEKYNTTKGGKKGNVTLQSYDGLTKIQVSVADFIQFGAQLQIAKSLIDECIHGWSDGANENIKALIFDAFRVDKNNRVNTDRILGLRRLNITDEKWQQAMTAINDSIRVSESKTYIRFYRRPSPEANWEAVILDLAAV